MYVYEVKFKILMVGLTWKLMWQNITQYKVLTYPAFFCHSKKSSWVNSWPVASLACSWLKFVLDGVSQVILLKQIQLCQTARYFAAPYQWLHVNTDLSYIYYICIKLYSCPLWFLKTNLLWWSATLRSWHTTAFSLC